MWKSSSHSSIVFAPLALSPDRMTFHQQHHSWVMCGRLISAVMNGTNQLLIVFQLVLVIRANLAKVFDITESEGNSSTRIVGGTEINVGAIPFICSVRQHVLSGRWSWTRVHLCGSTIVNENWLLTSAHCVFDKDITSLLVVCGIRQAKPVERIDFKPDYIDGGKGNDLALILLKKALTFTANVQPIPIFDQPILPYSMATLVGYGLSAYGDEGWQANGLQAATVPILTFEACSQRLGTLATYLTSDIICTDNGLSAAGTCLGDSGGPVIVATELQPFNLLAIPTWTVTPCGSGPSMHTLISPHIGWILTVITPNLI
ncbi:trypsin-1-like [Topomyia yanbarensis]|uniref:trypsin-1-like n=1 Tax=Topomyia yanbarensis TaxID=2498891 RepID=UPI00273C542C|nr:trypsin-1-like [Topomyia yanbarensis]